MDQSGFIQLDKGALHYLRFGEGVKVLIAFHGYGNEASIFKPFLAHLQQHFTIYSIDLPHHGKSVWKNTIALEKKDFVNLVKQIQDECKVDKVSLLGYSMGGRVCLSIIEQIPDIIDRVLLIAPDGLVFSSLYYFVTKNFAGKRLFKSLLTQPERLMKFIEQLRKNKWLNESRYKFAMWYLQSERDRSFLLKVWPGMRKIVPDLDSLKKTINKHKISINIYLGRYDKIITVSSAERFKKGLKSVHLHVLEKGHRVFDHETMPIMAKYLTS